MKRIITLLALLSLGGCQAVTSSTGTVEGITLPAGCKGNFTIIVSNGLIVSASINGSCDETGATASSLIKLR